MKSDIVVRKMELKDVAEAAKIERECFTMPWSEKAFEDSLAQPYAVFFIAESTDSETAQKRMAGYVGVYHMGYECDITNVAVSSLYRRKGVGRKLLQAVEEYAVLHEVKSVTLEVRESNTPAINLYEAMAYEKIGIRKKFYEKPIENAIIMVRQF